MMLSNSIVIISVVVLYFIIIIIALNKYISMSFFGNEVAGNAMAKGLTFLYGLGIIFLIAIFLTIINAFFYKEIISSSVWIKFIFYIPIVLPLLIFILIYFNIKLPYFNIDKLVIKTSRKNKNQARELIFEIRTKRNLNNLGLVCANKKESIIYMLAKKVENGYYKYMYKNHFIFDDDSLFYISTDKYKTTVFSLSILENTLIDFTDWKKIDGIDKKTQDYIKIDFRYKIIIN